MARTATRNIGKAEFMSLFHQHQAETLCQKKFFNYAQQVQDSQLRNMLENFGSQCQQRSNWLASSLTESGGANYVAQ